MTPKHLTVQSSSEMVHGFLRIRSWVEDEEGNEISEAELTRLHENLDAVGYWVICRADSWEELKLKGYPASGRVTGINDRHVYVLNKPVLKEDFLSLYEID